MSDEPQIYYATPIVYAVHRKGENPMFGEGVLEVKLEDEAAGFFIILFQEGQEIRCDLEELKIIYDTASKMIEEAERNV